MLHSSQTLNLSLHAENEGVLLSKLQPAQPHVAVGRAGTKGSNIKRPGGGVQIKVIH